MGLGNIVRKISKDKGFLAASFALLATGAFDAISTYYGIKLGVGSEANPFMQYSIDTFGLGYGLVISKGLMLGSSIAILANIQSNKKFDGYLTPKSAMYGLSVLQAGAGVVWCTMISGIL